jgi:hypothetical protein
MYATAMLNSLQSERDSERRSHQQTRFDAQSKISLLEAQLARREAQLEACIAHTPECFPLPQQSAQSQAEPIEQNEAVKVLETTLAKNRSLEAEVVLLAERVRSSILSVFITPVYTDI